MISDMVDNLIFKGSKAVTNLTVCKHQISTKLASGKDIYIRPLQNLEAFCFHNQVFLNLFLASYHRLKHSREEKKCIKWHQEHTRNSGLPLNCSHSWAFPTWRSLLSWPVSFHMFKGVSWTARWKQSTAAQLPLRQGVLFKKKITLQSTTF